MEETTIWGTVSELPVPERVQNENSFRFVSWRFENFLC